MTMLKIHQNRQAFLKSPAHSYTNNPIFGKAFAIAMSKTPVKENAKDM